MVALRKNYMFASIKLSRFCKQFQSHESLLPPSYVHFNSFTVPSRLFILLFNFCFWCMLDKSFNETTLRSSDDICFWNSFLFALTSWKLLPSALWVRYFSEEGVDLTTKQDKVFPTASTAHGWVAIVAKMF